MSQKVSWKIYLLFSLLFFLVQTRLSASDSTEIYYIYNMSGELVVSEIPGLSLTLPAGSLKSDKIQLKVIDIKRRSENATGIGWAIDRLVKERSYYGLHELLYKEYVNVYTPEWPLKIPMSYQTIWPERAKYYCEQIYAKDENGDKVASEVMEIRFRVPLDTVFNENPKQFRLDGVPVKFMENTEANIQYGFDNKTWENSGYRVIASHVNLHLNQNLIFLQSIDSSYAFDLTLLPEKPTLLRKGWQVKFTLDDAASIKWDQIIAENDYNIYDKYGKELAISYVDGKEILWTIGEKGIIPGRKYTIKNLPFRTTGFPGNVNIHVSVSEDHQTFVEVGDLSASHDPQSFKVINPKIKTLADGNKPFMTVFRDQKLELPPVFFSEGDETFIDNSIKLQFIIPDSVNLHWANRSTSGHNDQYEGLKISENRFQIAFQEIDGLSHKEIKITGIRFETMDQSLANVRLHAVLENKAQRIELTFPMPINVGKPYASAESDYTILGNTNEPIIKGLTISEDPVVSTLGVGDRITYELGDKEIKFDESHLKTVQKPGSFEIEYEKKKPQQITFKITQTLKPSERLNISNLPIRFTKTNSRKIKTSFNYATSAGLSKIESDEYSIEVINIHLDLDESREYLPKMLEGFQVVKLPDITIENDGEITTLQRKTLSISLPDSLAYTFDKAKLRSIGFSVNKIRLDAEMKKLVIDLPDGIPAKAKYSLSGLKIRLPVKETKFIKQKLIGSVGKDLADLYSSRTLSFDAPTMTSEGAQLLVEDGLQTALYAINFDFNKLRQVYKQTNDIILKIPDSLDLKWDPTAVIKLENNLHEIKALESLVLENDKQLKVSLIPNVDGWLEKVQTSQFLLFGLKFQAPIIQRSTEFQLLVSLDGGRTFGMRVNPKISIIPQTYRAMVDRQRVLEEFYPFKKGQVIVLIVSSQRFRWSSDNKTVHYSKSDVDNFKDVLFENEMIHGAGGKELRVKIAYDLDHPKPGTKRYQMMDFGQDITIGQLTVTDALKSGSPPRLNDQVDISVRFSTLYGPRIRQKSDANYIVKIDRNGQSFSVTLGLKKYPVTEALENPRLINWYRFQNQLVGDLNIGVENQAGKSRDELEKSLKVVRDKLNSHYELVGQGVEYDWVYWYYMAWYKKQVQSLNGNQGIENYRLKPAAYNDIPPESDYKKAVRYGYNPGLMSAIFPDLKAVDGSLIRKEQFVQALKLYHEGRYIKAEDILISNIDKPGMENYLKAAYFTVLGKIGQALSDTTTFYDGGYTYYPCEMFKRAKGFLQYDRNAFLQIKGWQPQLLNWAGEDCFNSRSVSEVATLARDTPSPAVQRGEFPAGKSSSIQIDWLHRDQTKNFDLYYTLQGYRSYSEDGSVRINYSKRQNVHAQFNDPVHIVGGNTYMVKYSPVKKSILNTVIILMSCGFMVTWLAI